MSQSLMRTYARLPLDIDRGEGAYVWDTHGRRYLDALGGIAVCALGHAHPAVTHALCEQAGTLVHCSNLYGLPLQERLAEALLRLTEMDSAFFCNSGAEANEAAIKLARLHGHRHGIEAPQILVMDGAFHGRTMATVTATGNTKAQAGFEPLLPGFTRIPFGDLAAARAAAAQTSDLAAILVEPIQGEGGVRMPPPGYIEGLRAVCDEYGLLLMVDEVQSGMGRTGEWCAFQHAGVSPDVVTLAKALGNGVPIGACLARGDAADVLTPGSHGSTFGGNPLACAAALAVIETIETQQLTQRAAALGERIRARMAEALDGHSGVVEIRGRGLMIGIELDRPCADLVKRALNNGLLINVTAERVVRLLPPYTLTDEQAGQIADQTAGLIAAFLRDDD